MPAKRVEVGRRCVGVEHHDGPAKLRFADGTSAVADLVVGPEEARDAAMAASFGLSPDIDWLYGNESAGGPGAQLD